MAKLDEAARAHTPFSHLNSLRGPILKRQRQGRKGEKAAKEPPKTAPPFAAEERGGEGEKQTEETPKLCSRIGERRGEAPPKRGKIEVFPSSPFLWENTVG